MSDKDWEKTNRKIVACLRKWANLACSTCVSRDGCHSIVEETQCLYERKKTQNKAFAIRKLVNLKLRKVQLLRSI